MLITLDAKKGIIILKLIAIEDIFSTNHDLFGEPLKSTYTAIEKVASLTLNSNQFSCQNMAGKTAAGFVIFRRINNTVQYLLLQASYGDHHWTPPKGHVDPGETNEMMTALRETEEEAGLKESDLKIYEDSKRILNYLVKGRPKTVIYWLAELVNPNTQVKLSDEHQDMKWLQFKEACVIGKYKEMNDLLTYCDNYIKHNL